MQARITVKCNGNYPELLCFRNGQPQLSNAEVMRKTDAF